MNLNRIMVWDVWATGVSTLLTIIGAPVIGDWLGISAWIPFGIGLALVPWTGFLAYTARQRPLVKWQTLVIAVGNLSWAVVAGIIVFGYPDALTPTGRWLLGLFSLVVLDFGVLQAIGLRRWDRVAVNRRRESSAVI